MLNIPALEKLVLELNRLPGVGPKTAERLAYFILKTGETFNLRFQEALQQVLAEVHSCPKCFNYTDSNLCKYCSDPHRQDDVLCIVEEPSDIMRIESSGAFRGRYHVLHGTISPLDGVGPQNLKIQELVSRVEQANSTSEPAIRELILALDTDLEGDTTTLYLQRLFHGKKIRISRIAHGVPIGSDIDFIDDRTMGRALENRVEI